MKFRRLQKLKVSRFGRLPQVYKSSNGCWDPGVRVFILLNFLHIRQGAAETLLSRGITVWEWTAQWRSWRGVTRASMNNPSSVSQKAAPMNSTARWAKLGWDACVLLAVDIVCAEQETVHISHHNCSWSASPLGPFSCAVGCFTGIINLIWPCPQTSFINCQNLNLDTRACTQIVYEQPWLDSCRYLQVARSHPSHRTQPGWELGLYMHSTLVSFDFINASPYVCMLWCLSNTRRDPQAWLPRFCHNIHLH